MHSEVYEAYYNTHDSKHKEIQSKSNLSDLHMNILNHGRIYCFGRDNCLRPIIIFKWAKIIEISKLHSLKIIKETFEFMMNFIKENLLLPGQIENFVSIMDFENVDVMDMCHIKNALEA